MRALCCAPLLDDVSWRLETTAFFPTGPLPCRCRFWNSVSWFVIWHAHYPSEFKRRETRTGEEEQRFNRFRDQVGPDLCAIIQNLNWRGIATIQLHNTDTLSRRL